MPQYTHSLDPDKRLVLVLDCDKDLSPDVQPRFFARTPTVRRATTMISAAIAAQSMDVTALSRLVDAVGECVVGWENMSDPDTGEPMEFSRDALVDVLTIHEMIELLLFVLSAGQPSGGDKKKSESPR